MQNPAVTIASQYGASPVINALITAANAWFDPGPNIDALYAEVLNLDTATGYGLDRWGRIVNAPRVINIAGFGSYALSDGGYRLLINAKALANISDGSIFSCNQILLTLFPGTQSYVVDNEDMTLTIHLPFTPSPLQSAILGLPGVFPKPSGVSITVPGGGGTLAMSLSTAGSTITAPQSSAAFGNVTATMTGGSGSYSIAWSDTVDANGTWVQGPASGATSNLSVSAVPNTVTATGTLTCVGTDTVTSATKTSSAVFNLDNTTVPGTFTVNIGKGTSIVGTASTYTFAPNAAVIGNAPVGTPSYQWFETDDAQGTWAILGPTNQDASLQVTARSGVSTSATLYCVVTIGGVSVTSNSAVYLYTNIHGGGFL